MVKINYKSRGFQSLVFTTISLAAGINTDKVHFNQSIKFGSVYQLAGIFYKLRRLHKHPEYVIANSLQRI